MKERSVLLLFLHRAAYGADEIDNEQRILIALNILQNQCLLLDADVRMCRQGSRKHIFADVLYGRLLNRNL